MQIRGKKYTLNLSSPAMLDRIRKQEKPVERSRQKFIEKSKLSDLEGSNEELAENIFKKKNIEGIRAMNEFLEAEIDLVLGKGKAAEILGVSSIDEADPYDAFILYEEVTAALEKEIKSYSKKAKDIELRLPVGEKG